MPGENASHTAEDAFQIGRVYLASPRNSAGTYLLITAAVAAHRTAQKAREKQPEPVAA